MKYAIGFVLYNPSENNIEHVKKCASLVCFERVYVVDNSEEDNSCGECLKKESSGLKYYKSPVNTGLSIAYNRMIKRAKRDGVDYLCIMDQDSVYPETEMRKMIAFLDKYKNDRFAIIAPRTFTNTDQMKDYKRQTKISEARFAINSGSFLSIRLFAKEDLRYDPHIFVDGVDYEMGMSIRKAGMKVGIYEGSVFVQNMGHNDGNSHFNKHATFRYGLIAKNRIYIYRKHYGIIIGTVYAILRNLYLIGKIILHEDEKIDKVKIVLSETFSFKRK